MPMLICVLCWYGCHTPSDSSTDEPYIISQDTPFFGKIKHLPEDADKPPPPPLPAPYAHYNLVIDAYGNIYGHAHRIPELCGYMMQHDRVKPDNTIPSEAVVRIDTSSLQGALSAFLQPVSGRNLRTYIMIASPVDTVYHKSLMRIASFLNERSGQFVYFIRHTTTEENALIAAGPAAAPVTVMTNEKADTLVYKLALPARDSSGIFPETNIKIKKDTARQTFLAFEGSGTETNIAIADSMQEIRCRNRRKCFYVKRLDFTGDTDQELLVVDKNWRHVRRVHAAHDGNNMLDISDLAAGVYYIHYKSCYTGGVYKMVLTE